jgi:MFS family permease
VAAYALPAPVGAALLARLVRRFHGVQLVAVDAVLRAVALGLVAILAVAGLLSPVGYVALLAVSSLLHAWGSAGAYTLVAELLPDDDRVTGNALLSTFTQGAVVVGPALAGGLTALVGPGLVIGADAASFAVLAASCWAAARRRAGPIQVPSRFMVNVGGAHARDRPEKTSRPPARRLAHHPRPTPAARVDRGDLCLLLSLRPGRGGAADPRRP